MNFVKLCFASSDAELSKIENAYVALFVVSVALARGLEEAGIVPALVAGHDIGEYAAVSVIGGLSVPDALYLLKKYGLFYQHYLDQKEAKGLRIVGLPLSELEKLCKKVSKKGEIAAIAVVEGDEQGVVMATETAATMLKELLQNLSYVTFSSVSVGGGFHAPVMDEIVKQMKMYLEKVDFKTGTVPFVSGVIGQPLEEGEMIRAALMQHIHAQTQWSAVEEAFTDCEYILEVGPGTSLRDGFAKRYPHKRVVAINSLADITQIAQEIREKSGMSKQQEREVGQ